LRFSTNELARGTSDNAAAAKALQGAVANAPAANQAALCEGLFRCAESLASQGQRNLAIELYDQVLKLDATTAIRTAALRGSILTRQNDGLSLLRQHVRDDDYTLFVAAVRTAQEMPQAGATKVLTDELNRLSADNQILIILTLGKRADAAALPALFGLARSGAKSVRVAAVQALQEIGHADAVPVLAELLADADREISQAAQEALAALPGRQADAAVMTMLNSSETSRRLTALELIGRRRMMTSIPALLETAHDADTKVRSAAIEMIGELGGPSQLSALLDLLMDFQRSQELSSAERALTAACRKADDPRSHADELIDRLDDAGSAQKSVLLRILGAIGGTNALEAVRAAIGDRNAQVRAEAIRALCAWKTVNAAPDLLVLAKTAGNPNDKTLCLRGYLGMAARPDVPGGQRLSMCRQAAGLVQRDAEKKLLLGALGRINSPGSLALIMPYLDDPAMRAEAGMASVAIAEAILKGRSTSKLEPQLVAPLEKVVQVTTNADLARRAKALLQQARSKTRRR